jgi:hypothetical protein
MNAGVPSSPPGGLPSTPNNFRSSPPLLDDDEDEIDDNGGIMDLEDLDEEMDGINLMENMERCVCRFSHRYVCVKDAEMDIQRLHAKPQI